MSRRRVRFEFMKTVEYWHPTEGAGTEKDGSRNLNHYISDISHMDCNRDFWNAEEIPNLLASVLDEHYLRTNYFSIMDDGRISFNQLEDCNENTVQDNDQAQEMHNNGVQLFMATYDVFIEVQDINEPSVEVLSQIFPNSEVVA